MPVAIITPILISAAVGAVSAAVTGGNILKGALFGAISGGIGGALSGVLGGAAGAAGGAASGLTEGAIAAAGAESAVSSAGQLASAGFGDIAAGLEAAGGAGAIPGAAEAAAAGAMPVPAQALPPLPKPADGMIGAEVHPMEAMAPAAPGQAAPAAPGVQTGLGPDVSNTGLAGGPDRSASTGLGRDLVQTGISTPAASGGFLDTLLNKATGMINNRAVMDFGGQVVKGYAAGKAQEASQDWKTRQIQDERANSRFGNTGSRFNINGMIGATPTYK